MTRDKLHCWIIAITLIQGSIHVRSQEDAEYWNTRAQSSLKKAIERAENLNRNVAKNVVMLIGDGMGPSTVSAARIFKGQQEGSTGEEAVLSWENFPSYGLAKTYNTDRQVADSAGTATAYFCGVKSKYGVLGMDDNVVTKECPPDIKAISVDSVMTQAQRAGKSTGIVTTARVTHATPGALYAHTPSRGWENDGEISSEEAAKGCTDIALQMVTNANQTKVILGGGRREMFNHTVPDPEYTDEMGKRKDGRNLTDEWLAYKDPATSKYVWNLDDFNNVDPETTEYLLGLFEPSHMKYESTRPDDVKGEPSIAQMAEKALKILQKDSGGFFLAIEGGKIDHGNHDTSPYNALHDAIAFDEAVSKVIEMTNENETLIIVTADHSHVLTFGGNPSRGNPILGLDDSGVALDDLPYTTIQYGNGEGGTRERDSFNANGKRRNLTDVDTEGKDFTSPATYSRGSETHGGEDVSIYASGPMSHLFHGVHEQHYIAHVVRYAACLDEDKDHCKTTPRTVPPPITHYTQGECEVGPGGGTPALIPHAPLCLIGIALLRFLQV